MNKPGKIAKSGENANLPKIPMITVPMSAGSWAFGILRKTIKKPFLRVFPMPTKNLQKTLKKPSAAPGNFKKTSKNHPAPLKPSKNHPWKHFLWFWHQQI